MLNIVLVFNEGERRRLRVFELLRMKCGHNLMQMIQSVGKKLVTVAVGQSTHTADRGGRKEWLGLDNDNKSTHQSGAL